MKCIKHKKYKIYTMFFVLVIVVCVSIGVYLSNAFNAYGEKNIVNTDIYYNGKTTDKEESITRHVIDIEGLSQDDIPTGCEAVSTVSVLKYYGENITPDDFIRNYLPMEDFYEKNGMVYGPDPSKAFAGNPYESGSLGCYCEVIEAACINMQKSNNRGTVNLEVKAVRGIPLSQLETYISNGKPVIIWVTIEMKESYDGFTYYLKTGEKYVWRAGEHCVVLCGYDDKCYYIMDPLKNGQIVRYDKSLVEERYGEMGEQAVLIERVK